MSFFGFDESEARRKLQLQRVQIMVNAPTPKQFAMVIADVGREIRARRKSARQLRAEAESRRDGVNDVSESVREAATEAVRAHRELLLVESEQAVIRNRLKRPLSP
jgi:hypothetical protein